MTWSEGAKLLFGHQGADIIGQSYQRLLPLDDRQIEISRQLKRVSTEGRLLEDRQLQRHDGSLFWANIMLYPLHSPASKTEAFVVIMRDSSIQKEQDRELQQVRQDALEGDEAIERLAAIVESSDDAIIGKSIDGFITSWNKGAQQLYGYTAQEIIGQPVSVLMPPEKKDDFPKIMDQLQKGKKVEHYETKRRAKDGRIIDVSLTVSPIRNPQGIIIGASKVARDITERKKLEERHRFLENASKVLGTSINYRTTLENLSQIIVPELADYCRIVVLDQDQQIKEIVTNHIDPNKIALMQELYEAYKDERGAGVGRLIQTGKPELISHVSSKWLEQANPRVKALAKELNLQSYMGVPMKAGNKIVGVLTLSSSDSNRIYTKADLSLAKELASRAALAIENARLYAESQAAVALRDDFISVASHELKTPITSTKIFTQVLLRQAQRNNDLSTMEHLHKMDRQINKLTQLIHDMLDISRMQMGRMELNRRPFSFDQSVQEIVETLQSAELQHQIIINGQTQQQVIGDEDRIGQVVSNLISNAIKYSPKAQQINIQLSTDGQTVTCGIQDFGIGISPEHQPHIFERFYRVSEATDKTFPGLGIGLYVSSEIIQRHHGRLWVESQPGQGSTFYFNLPVQSEGVSRGSHLSH